MTTWELLVSTWVWEPSVVIGCIGLAIGYLWLRRWRIDGMTWFFLGGVVTILFALVSSLDGLGDKYLFSAHMMQHLLLILLAPPLMLLGLPAGLLRRLLSWRPVAIAERVFGHPAVAWTVAMVTLWVWHLPVLYDGTLEFEGLHILEHLSFLFSWTVFWWPIWSPLEERRLPPHKALVYLVPAAFANTLLGILITFAAPGLYPAYLHPEGSAAGIQLIRQGWGFSAAADQQLGGLLMWVLGMIGFIWPILAEVGRIYRTDGDEEMASQGGLLKTKRG